MKKMQNWQENIPMTKDKFWEVINNARAIAPALEGEPLRESLYKQLLTLSPDELVGFDCAWQEYRRIANSPQLIAAACIINGGTSDDRFDYFKNWLILQGQYVFRQALKDPDALAALRIVYCAHCGAKMSGFMHTDRYKLADGSIREKVQPKYNCFQRGQRNKGGRDCDGQALYLAERVDAIVLKIVEEVFEQIRDTPYSQVAENRIRQESNLQKTKRAAAEKKIKAAQHALERFEGEILKCLDGTSNFTEDMIAKQIRRYQQELDDAKAEYAELQNARLNEAAEIRKLRTYYDDFKGWAEEFDTAPLEMKRMILSHLIDRVEVGRKYQVIVKFNMKYRQFLECTAETYNTEIGA